MENVFIDHSLTHTLQTGTSIVSRVEMLIAIMHNITTIYNNW